jgi:type IV pilus assembly protein PilB
MLVGASIASREDVEEAATTASRSGRRIGEMIVDLALAEERDVYRTLAEQQGLRFAEFGDLLDDVDHEVLREVSRAYQESHRLIPLRRERQTLVVASCDPLEEIPAAVASAARCNAIERHVITPTDYRRLRITLALEHLKDSDHHAPAREATPDLLAAETSFGSRPAALFDAMLLEAMAERASDIHLEVYGNDVRVRLRIDGDLRDTLGFQPTAGQLLSLVNVIKVRAGLDIAERRVPQGGRFTTRTGGHVYDVRVQTQPALHGEHVVLRLLSQDTRLLTIGELGFPPAQARTYRRLLRAPSGLTLVVGPTGSGKSTTLYAGLQVLAQDPARKVITIEDPIEYAIPGIQQAQVRPELGFGFAHAMRAFVREDPDVILIGEIRDAETALEALRASQTGHLVLSTLHCNDAVDAVQRLIDLGMHPSSIASELVAVFAQRLAKRICEGCRAPAVPDPELMEEVFPGGPPKDFRVFRGTGCDHCNGSGTFGRVAVVEHLAVSWLLRRAIVQREPVDELRASALAQGLVPMRDQALAQVAAGTIAFEELRDLLPTDRLAPEVPVEPARAALRG